MYELFHHILIVLVPLIITSIIHMIVVKLNWLNFVKIPIWENGFGENKTWRGVLIVPIANAIILYTISIFYPTYVENAFLLGFLLGISYLLFELPNSFVKRKMGIKPGERATSNKVLFFVLDKTDSAFGVTLTYYFMMNISLKLASALFLTNSFPTKIPPAENRIAARARAIRETAPICNSYVYEMIPDQT